MTTEALKQARESIDSWQRLYARAINAANGLTVPERASECGLTECQGRPMCDRCAYSASAGRSSSRRCWPSPTRNLTPS